MHVTMPLCVIVIFIFVLFLPVRLTKKLKVRECNLAHNHRVGEEILAHYPSSRKLSVDEEREVKNILSLRPNNKHLKEMIVKKFGKLVTLKDIQNMKTKVREHTRKGLGDAQLILDHLQEALEQDKSARGGVIVDEEHTLEVLYFQTGHMSKIFRRFPEILLVDGTYNVNRQGMPLYCLMAEDGYGRGRVTFYAATAEEDALHLQKIMQSFKEENPTWSSVRVVIIDKDFTEWRVLKEEFPNATVLFCQWHVIKAMFKKVVDCGVAKSDRDEARELIRCLVHAKDESGYEKLRQDVFDATNDEFKQYFLKNWDNCQNMWVTFKRDTYVHLGNTTNNRLECHNQKLKDLTSHTSSLSEMFANVLRFARASEAEYKQSSFTEEFTSVSSADDGISGVPEIRAVCTQYAATMIVEQLKLAHSVGYQINEKEGENVLVSPSGRLHTVHIDGNIGNACSCSFHRTVHMPCRHIFAARLHQQLPTFELTMVAERWQKQYQLLVDEANSDAVDPSGLKGPEVQVSSIPLGINLTGTLARNQKYRKMQTLCQKLAIIASQYGMAEFRKKYEEVQSLIRHWELNTPIVITPVTDSGEVS